MSSKWQHHEGYVMYSRHSILLRLIPVLLKYAVCCIFFFCQVKTCGLFLVIKPNNELCNACDILWSTVITLSKSKPREYYCFQFCHFRYKKCSLFSLSSLTNKYCTSKGLISTVLLFTYTGWPRHRENRECGCLFFQTGKTQGICQKILKIWFYTGNLPPTQGKFWSFKIKISQSCDEI